MFEMAADYVKFNKTEFELLGGYLSPGKAYCHTNLLSFSIGARRLGVVSEPSDRQRDSDGS
jgi:hypothetical protein